MLQKDVLKLTTSDEYTEIFLLKKKEKNISPTLYKLRRHLTDRCISFADREIPCQTTENN